MARHRRGGRGLRGGRQPNPRGSGGSGRDEANSSGADAGNHSGYNYDDHSSVGQSQPADQSQTRPPLAEEPAALLRKKFEAIGIHVRRAEPIFPPGPGYGADEPPLAEEAAALLRKKFEAIGIHVRRAEPVFPPGPGYDAAGVVRANRFLGRLVDEGPNQYTVTISPEPTLNGGAYREVMMKQKLAPANQRTELGGRFPAYNSPDVLFTAGALPFNNYEFEVTLSAGCEKRKYKVAISLLQPRMLLAGYPTDIPAQAQVLETVLRDAVFNERDDIERVPIGTNDHTLGVEAWKGRGLYQSISSIQDGLSLIADVCSSVFVRPLLLIDIIQKILKIEQCYQKNLEYSQVSVLRKSASIQPGAEQSSHQVVDCRLTKCANEFGTEFDDNLTTVHAVLPPNLEYHDFGSQKSWFPMNGYWDMKDKGIYGYPIEIQAVFFKAVKYALSWLDFGTINDIHSFKTEESLQIALSKLNVLPGSASDCIFEFIRLHGGYLISNDGPALDFRWFCLGILIATTLATREQAKSLLHIVDECWQRLIGEMPLKICYPATENPEWQIITGCDQKNTRWSYNNEGSWPDAAYAWEALKRSIVYIKGKPIGTEAAIHKSQGTEFSDAQLGPNGFSPKQLIEIVQKINVSNKLTICLDKSVNGSYDESLKTYQAGIGGARLWCLKHGLRFDFSHIYGGTVFGFTTPPGGTLYVTLKLEGKSITLLLAGRDHYIKGWRNDDSHESFEFRMEKCSAYMLGNPEVMNIEKNYMFLCPGGKVGGTRIGPDALREAFHILYKCRGKRSPEVRRANGMLAVNISEAIRIQKVYKTVCKSFQNSDEQVLDPILIAPEEPTQDPQDTNTFWIENYGHYSQEAMVDANARDSDIDPPGIENRDGANIESATEIFREIRVVLRDACPEGANETKPPKIEDPDDRINHSFTRDIKKRRKGKGPGDGESPSAESLALFLLEDWLPVEDEINNDASDSEGDREAENGMGSDLEAGHGDPEEVDWVNFSVVKFLERIMEEKVRNMRISEWLNRLQKTENFHQIHRFNAEKATVKKFIAPKPKMLQRGNAVSLGQRLMHRVSRWLRFL